MLGGADTHREKKSRWKVKHFVRFNWWDDSLCVFSLLFVLRYHSHAITFTLFLTGHIKFFHDFVCFS